MSKLIDINNLEVEQNLIRLNTREELGKYVEAQNPISIDRDFASMAYVIDYKLVCKKHSLPFDVKEAYKKVLQTSLNNLCIYASKYYIPVDFFINLNINISPEWALHKCIEDISKNIEERFKPFTEWFLISGSNFPCSVPHVKSELRLHPKLKGSDNVDVGFDINKIIPIPPID